MKGLASCHPGKPKKLETAAAAFKQYWESGCAAPEVYAGPLGDESAEALDPAFVALLRAVECGDDRAIPALASYLEKRGDPRATAIRNLTRLEFVVKETLTGGEDVAQNAELRLDGRTTYSSRRSAPGETEVLRAQHVRELQTQSQSQLVWDRLGLSQSQQYSLKPYLGINPTGVPATIKEIAERDETHVQTIRQRIDLALHKLIVPCPRKGRQQ